MLLCRGDTPAWTHPTNPCTQAVHHLGFSERWAKPLIISFIVNTPSMQLYTSFTFISHNFFKMLHVCRCFLYLHAAFVQCHLPFS